MASSLSTFHSLNPSHLGPRLLQTLTRFPNSPFLSQCSVFSFKNTSLLNSITRFAPLQTQRVRSKTLVLSAQSSFFKVLRTAWNIGKDGIEAGTNLVPVSVPRPVARISVTIAAMAVSLFVLKSFLSTAFFVLGTMGFAYFLFIALNKDEAPKQGRENNSSGSKPMDDPLEEAKKIMDKYKSTRNGVKQVIGKAPVKELLLVIPKHFQYIYRLKVATLAMIEASPHSGFRVILETGFEGGTVSDVNE